MRPLNQFEAERLATRRSEPDRQRRHSRGLREAGEGPANLRPCGDRALTTRCDAVITDVALWDDEQIRGRFGAIRNRATRRHTTKRANFLRFGGAPRFEPKIEVCRPHQVTNSGHDTLIECFGCPAPPRSARDRRQWLAHWLALSCRVRRAEPQTWITCEAPSLSPASSGSSSCSAAASIAEVSFLRRVRSCRSNCTSGRSDCAPCSCSRSPARPDSNDQTALPPPIRELIGRHHCSFRVN